MDRMGASCCGDALRTRVAVLFARTSVSQVEKAGDGARFALGVAVRACW